MKQKSYKKPKIKKKKIIIAEFYQNDRIIDGYDELSLLNFEILASSHCCLLPGMKITLKDGSSKVIEKISVGDKVLSIDTNSMTETEGTVEKVHVYPDNSEGYFIINDTLKVTSKHPIWIKNRGWTEATNIKKGDEVYLISSHTYSPVESITFHENTGVVYDLSIAEEHHNYFAEGFLVHNKTHT